MPFILNQTEEELKKQRDNQNISGSSTVIDPNNANLNTPNSTNTPKSSGSFTNLQSYLDANGEQAAEMGQKIVNDVESSASSAKNSIDNLSSSVSSVNSIDADYLNNTFFNDPTQADKQSYLDLKKGYTGPTDISKVSSYGDSINAWNKASESLKNSSTESGRQQLLKSTYSNPGYSAGQNMLDQTLLQNNAASKNAFENVQSKWSGLNSLLDSTTTNVGNKIKSNVETDFNNKNLIQQTEQSAQENLINPIKERATQYNSNIGDYQKAYRDSLKSNTFTEKQLADLGLTEGVNTYGEDLSKYYNDDLTVANANNMATSEERARYKSLQSLLDGVGMDVTDNGQSLKGYQYDVAGLEAGIQRSKNAYDNKYMNENIAFNGSQYWAAPTAHGIQTALNNNAGNIKGTTLIDALENWKKANNAYTKVTKK